MPGVLSAALLATDLGDHDVAHGLLFDWDRVRRALGLPVPQGFERLVADRYGVDPAVTSPAGPWTEEPLADLVKLAAAWCGGVTP
jgi:hypothetical protein